MWLRVSQVQSCLLSRQEAGSADVLIAPAIAPAGMGDAEGREAARRRGYEAATAALPAIRAAMRRRGFSDERESSVSAWQSHLEGPHFRTVAIKPLK